MGSTVGYCGSVWEMRTRNVKNVKSASAGRKQQKRFLALPGSLCCCLCVDECLKQFRNWPSQSIQFKSLNELW